MLLEVIRQNSKLLLLEIRLPNKNRLKITNNNW